MKKRLDALEAETPDRELIQKLHQLRQERRRQREQAQQQLREVVTPEQEARLILMGYLD